MQTANESFAKMLPGEIEVLDSWTSTHQRATGDGGRSANSQKLSMPKVSTQCMWAKSQPSWRESIRESRRRINTARRNITCRSFVILSCPHQLRCPHQLLGQLAQLAQPAVRAREVWAQRLMTSRYVQRIKKSKRTQQSTQQSCDYLAAITRLLRFLRLCGLYGFYDFHKFSLFSPDKK